ncbi:hypothetical protein GCM10009765_59180 [Fodinicola feengrottensis]|uniref:Uncharacterized protein n=1 Tax=Fodinicola feengrottensis TaxID=435914 RepID=A0ABN2IBD0_9ACTN
MSDTGGTMEVAREYWGVRMARRGYDANKDLNDPDGWGRWYQGQLQKTAEARGLHWEVAASKVYDVPRGMTWPNVQKQLDEIIAATPLQPDMGRVAEYTRYLKEKYNDGNHGLPMSDRRWPGYDPGL